MNTKKLLSLAIIATLPVEANSANISGAMYIAPAAADTNHPAPTTNVDAPYGRMDIDTTDQDHIASTAYVKGAYNSAIAAVNKVANDKQVKLLNANTQQAIQSYVLDGVAGDNIARQMTDIDMIEIMQSNPSLNTQLLSAAGVVGFMGGVLHTQVVPIYTTWNDDNATTGVNLMHTDNL